VKLSHNLKNKFCNTLNVGLTTININGRRILWVALIMTDRYFDFVIQLKKGAFEEVKIIMAAAYIRPLSNDLFDRESDNSLRYYIDAETSDWLNHDDRPINELWLPIHEP